LDFARLTLDEPAHVRQILFETEEIQHIYRGLATHDGAGLRERLGELVSGPPSYLDESPGGASHRPRDYGWELYVGAFFALAGFPPEFGLRGDVSVRIGEQHIFVECKRPSSEAKVVPRISEALDQLESDYASCDAPRRCRGIVALSMTKIINPRGGWRRYRTADELEADAQKRLGTFVGWCQHAWARPRDPRTLGAALSFRYMAEITTPVPTLTVVGDIAMSKTEQLRERADHDLMEPVLRTIMGPEGERLRGGA
jgi:hypothetical protein